MTLYRPVTCGMCRGVADGVLYGVQTDVPGVLRKFVVIRCPRCDVAQPDKPQETRT